METLPPMYFMTLRYVIGSAMLILAIGAVELFRCKKNDGTTAAGASKFRELYLGGMICGFFMAGGEILQQYGLTRTTAGKAGFLTTLSIIMVPLLGIFFRRKPSAPVWVAAFMALGGSYLLCAPERNGSFNIGDLLVLGCALFYAMQILAVSRYAPNTDALQLSCVQFVTVMVIGAIAAVVTGETLSCSGIIGGMEHLIFCGVFSSGIACTLQIAAQKRMHPATASIILSSESIFAVVGGAIILKEVLTKQQIIGCSLIFIAVILAQLPDFKRSPLPADVEVK